MCGIAGIARADDASVEAADVKRMMDAIAHRGPDSAGCHLAPGVGLGVRRLRIIDLVTGDQPISNEDGTVWTVFNGEIYNFEGLRDELVRRGHVFRTRSDTEVIVHSYEEHGDDFVCRLRGMFAIALWDAKRRRLLLARDRLGKKPLLYAQLGDELVFASEMQALVRLARLPRDIDMGALGDYLAYGYVPSPATIFRSARKLPPAHVLVWEAGAVSLRRYWELRYLPKLDLDDDEALVQLEARLDEAVRLRLISDVPLGALLSGGVDSSTVVALMARHSPAPVKTFSIGFDEGAYDELAHARRVAQRYGTEHHEFVVRADAASVLPLLVRHYGEPYADSSAVATYYVAKLARQEVTVALNGDGGDEAFAGYDRYRAMKWAQALPRLLAARPALTAAARLAGRFPGVRERSRSRAERFLRALGLSAPARYASWVSAISDELLLELASPQLLARASTERAFAVERAYEERAALGPIDRLLATDISTYLPSDLLAKMDIASMANSLETRSPLLDHEVLEFAAALPERFKADARGGQKLLLKRLARRLVPRENVDRPKMGFGVPIARWLRGDIRPLAEDVLFDERARSRGYFRSEAVRRIWNEHRDGRRDHGAALWSLLMLELWQREFVDRP